MTIKCPFCEYAKMKKKQQKQWFYRYVILETWGQTSDRINQVMIQLEDQGPEYKMLYKDGRGNVLGGYIAKKCRSSE